MSRWIGLFLMVFGYLASLLGLLVSTAAAAGDPGGDYVGLTFFLWACGAPFVFLGAGMRNSGRGPGKVARAILYSLLGLLIMDGAALAIVTARAASFP